jgi:hypothetical protein
MARITGNFLDGLFDLLRSGDEDAVRDVLVAVLGPAPSARVQLIEGELSVEEALRYVVALSEFGRGEDAVEVLAEIVRTFGVDPHMERVAA